LFLGSWFKFLAQGLAAATTPVACFSVEGVGVWDLRFKVWDSKVGVRGLEFAIWGPGTRVLYRTAVTGRVSGFGFKVYGSRFKTWDFREPRTAKGKEIICRLESNHEEEEMVATSILLRSRVQSRGFRVEGGHRVEGSESRVQGGGFRVEASAFQGLLFQRSRGHDFIGKHF
jgi:hypothetical protein